MTIILPIALKAALCVTSEVFSRLLKFIELQPPFQVVVLVKNADIGPLVISGC